MASKKFDEEELKTIRSLIVRLKKREIHEADWQLMKILHNEIDGFINGKD